MRLADVVDQDRHGQPLQRLRKDGVVLRRILGSVEGHHPRLSFVLALDLGGNQLELGLRSGHQDDVEPPLRELQRILLPNAVGGACDHRPGALPAAVLGEAHCWKHVGLHKQRAQREHQCCDLENTHCKRSKQKALQNRAIAITKRFE